MSEAVYERYKEALRRGHVAALRGRLDDALDAYSEAAAIAPERPLPYASMGGIQLRMGRLEEALASFGAALERAPRDEAALLGRADVLERLGRPAEAAAALDLAAEVQEAAGRPMEALESGARALELAESRPRRRLVRRLVEQARATGDASIEASIVRAVALLERVERTSPAPGDQGPAPEGPGPDAATDVAATEVGAQPGEAETTVPEPAVGALPAGAHVPAAAAPSEAEAEPEATAGRPEAAFEPFGAGASGRDPIALALVADEALASGDPVAIRDALLEAAAAEAAAGLDDSALDACYRALAVAPGDPDLHLALVDLYMARGWHALAARKLALLERLVLLDADGAALGRVRARAATAFLVAALRDEPPPAG